MLRSSLFVMLFSLFLLGAGHSQDPKKEDPKREDKEGKLKGFLPQYYGKLGLSTDQKQRVYKIRNETKAKLEELERQKAKLRADEKEALEKVLTPDQLKKLKDLRLGEKP